MIRFVHLFNYPRGISRKDGDSWYLARHVPVVRELPGIVRYRSWPQVDVGIPYPSAGAPTPFDQYARRTELCFESLAAFQRAYKANAELWTTAGEGKVGFGAIEGMLLHDEPEFDLLRDAPQQQYKYMTLALSWPNGRPEIDEDAEVFIDSYCLSYSLKISFTEGEDWYLGHHTREGKQLPGMKHYRTWRTIKAPDELRTPIDLNKWVRLTELGMSPAAYITDMVNDETRVRFTPSQYGNVLGGWLNISIKFGVMDDFLR